ncbi:hypothetical protein SAMN02745216_01953 [Desulfatibacillum alkenivorans DSM 16219]|uniref:AB hydrolase-1 domain-containing protein n=1 Tax=Desulfatibacillum alkenivorans DSM 16219 TaxID=1121393 RepID=A0A1M6KP29_9BACT|nr:alpha/beta fold hydrolase [Desulfatibacillum alkenivorans]SHJ60604.1 hypothetical protein SAMN02745216_01953 [Desulfatibacillum alkenivorans DSM 16219]
MAQTQSVKFKCFDLELEGLLDEQDGEKAVVVTHPHPLYGGDMHNIVVDSLARAYVQSGYTCLRFNFRGVGKSKGLHDDGNGERDDILAAVAYLMDLGKKDIHLAGYSFGAWVAARTQWKIEPPPLLMVAPPVDMLSFDDVESLPSLEMVIVGERDEFAPPYLIHDKVRKWNRSAKIIEIKGEDHFFFNMAPQLESTVMRHLRQREL